MATVRTPAEATARKRKRSTLAEQMAEFDKRRAKRLAARQDKAGKARLAKARARTCQRLRENKAQLDSGRRLRTLNESGQAVIITEQDRAERSRALSKRLRKCRS